MQCFFFPLVKPYFLSLPGKIFGINNVKYFTFSNSVFKESIPTDSVFVFRAFFLKLAHCHIIFVIKTTFFHSSGCFISAWSVQPRAVTTDRCLTTKMLSLLNLCVCASICVTCMCLRAVENPWRSCLNGHAVLSQTCIPSCCVAEANTIEAQRGPPTKLQLKLHPATLNSHPQVIW